MDRAALAELDRAALIAIILRQQALIEQLTARLAELGARLRQDSSSSSRPPSSDPPGTRAQRRAPLWVITGGPPSGCRSA